MNYKKNILFIPLRLLYILPYLHRIYFFVLLSLPFILIPLVTESGLVAASTTERWALPLLRLQPWPLPGIPEARTRLFTWRLPVGTEETFQTQDGWDSSPVWPPSSLPPSSWNPLLLSSHLSGWPTIPAFTGSGRNSQSPARLRRWPLVAGKGDVVDDGCLGGRRRTQTRSSGSQSRPGTSRESL